MIILLYLIRLLLLVGFHLHSQPLSLIFLSTGECNPFTFIEMSVLFSPLTSGGLQVSLLSRVSLYPSPSLHPSGVQIGWIRLKTSYWPLNSSLGRATFAKIRTHVWMSFLDTSPRRITKGQKCSCGRGDPLPPLTWLWGGKVSDCLLFTLILSLLGQCANWFFNWCFRGHLLPNI